MLKYHIHRENGFTRFLPTTAFFRPNAFFLVTIQTALSNSEPDTILRFFEEKCKGLQGYPIHITPPWASGFV